MMSVFQTLSPVIIVMLMAALVWFLRVQAAEKSRAQVLQLTEAAELLETHATSLEAFLDDPRPSLDLKRLLLSVSDAMADRQVVARLTEWAASRPPNQPLDSEATLEVQRSLDALRNERPDLVDNFTMTVLTAALGASLRWPESAALFSKAFPRMVATPKRDVAIAVTAAALRPEVPFSVRPSRPAMA
jgi:hypothetical protein